MSTADFENRLENSDIRLSPDDQKRFAQALILPPKPNAALERAFARRKKLLRPS